MVVEKELHLVQKIQNYCATYKPVDYVNVKTQCREDGCYKFPHFGFPGSIATSCITHMKEGMIHLRVRKCLEPGCNTRAVFNVVGSDKGKFCAKHKQSEMIDIQTKLCKYTGCQKKPSKVEKNPSNLEFQLLPFA